MGEAARRPYRRMVSRRGLVGAGLLGGAAVAALPLLARPGRGRPGGDVTATTRPLSTGWADATRVTFRAVDAYGNHRPYEGQRVRLELSGPVDLIGDNPFDFGR